MARGASRHVQLPASDASEAPRCRRGVPTQAQTHTGLKLQSRMLLGTSGLKHSGPTLHSPGSVLQLTAYPYARHRVDNIKLHLPRMALALAYKAFPCAVFPFTAQKPVTPNCLRACFTASHHFFNALCAQFFLPRADAALLTIFPLLLLVNVAFVKPPTVFAFLPLKTAALALLPRAMMLTFFTFFIAH